VVRPIYRWRSSHASTKLEKSPLVNHLGVNLGNTSETILDRLDRDDFTESDIEHPSDLIASDHDYARHVRGIDAATPARFNADPKRLLEASGSAGKVMIFGSAGHFSEGDDDWGVLHRHQ
jgi:hypothetical protein